LGNRERRRVRTPQKKKHTARTKGAQTQNQEQQQQPGYSERVKKIKRLLRRSASQKKSTLEEL